MANWRRPVMAAALASGVLVTLLYAEWLPADAASTPVRTPRTVTNAGQFSSVFSPAPAPATSSTPLGSSGAIVGWLRPNPAPSTGVVSAPRIPAASPSAPAPNAEAGLAEVDAIIADTLRKVQEAGGNTTGGTTAAQQQIPPVHSAQICRHLLAGRAETIAHIDGLIAKFPARAAEFQALKALRVAQIDALLVRFGCVISG